MDEKAIARIEYRQDESVKIFVENDIQMILDEIQRQVLNQIPDVSTVDGRTDIASRAYFVSKQKVKLDALGKELVSEWKDKARAVDNVRKQAREFLDVLRKKVRQPLTDWEAAEAYLAKAKKLAAEVAIAHKNAIEENYIFDRTRDLREREEELLRKEKRAISLRLEEEMLEKRKERERIIKADAKREAEREAQKRIDAVLHEKAEAVVRAEQAKIDAIKAERDRAAREKALEESERAKAKIKAARQAADLQHRRKINNEALAGFSKNGISIELGKKIIGLIARGHIPYINIKY